MNSTSNQNIGPTLDEINRAAQSLAGRIVKTPCVELTSSRIMPLLPDGCRAVMKLELFQNAGSFKARGALLSVDALDRTTTFTTGLNVDIEYVFSPKADVELRNTSRTIWPMCCSDRLRSQP